MALEHLPVGPVDIICRGNKITNIISLGLPTPGMASDANRTKLEPGGKEIQAEGMYLMPGFVDMHGHIGGGQAPDAEYVFKLWMAHGITTIREPGSGNGIDWVLEHKKNSAQNLITAPRIKACGFRIRKQRAYPHTGTSSCGVNENKLKGADGIKFFGAAPEIMDAALRENKRLDFDLPVTMHSWA